MIPRCIFHQPYLQPDTKVSYWMIRNPPVKFYNVGPDRSHLRGQTAKRSFGLTDVLGFHLGRAGELQSSFPDTGYECEAWYFFLIALIAWFSVKFFVEAKRKEDRWHNWTWTTSRSKRISMSLELLCWLLPFCSSTLSYQQGAKQVPVTSWKSTMLHST